MVNDILVMVSYLSAVLAWSVTHADLRHRFSHRLLNTVFAVFGPAVGLFGAIFVFGDLVDGHCRILTQVLSYSLAALGIVLAAWRPFRPRATVRFSFGPVRSIRS